MIKICRILDSLELTDQMLLEHNLLILGSQNSNPADQKLDRDEIRPVQILHRDGHAEPVNFFNNWGKVGVSSIAWNKHNNNQLIVSVNDELRKLDTKKGQYTKLDIPRIHDLHDIHYIGGSLWISNTEYDEIIEYNTKQESIISRISLDQFRTQEELQSANAEKIKDRFHCNQVFRDYEGNLCVLIHHISGWQYYRILLEKLVKNQGDGGIINLDRKKVIPLKLQSPHSLRMIDGDYWVQDSGDFSTKIFNKNWELIYEIENGGFGRGVDFSIKEKRVYIGISATRKRYLKVIPSGGYHMNRILILDPEAKTKIDEIPVYHIEQLDNVYIMNDAETEIFRNLDRS